MKYFIDTVMEKHAAGLSNWFGNLGMVKKYKQVAASPSFKIKKKIGQGVLVASPTAYAAHWLNSPEQPQGQAPGSRM